MPTSIPPSSTSILQNFNLAYLSSSPCVPQRSGFSFSQIRKRAILAEFLGTFGFLLAINTIIASRTATYTLAATAMGIGGALTTFIALLGCISGGFLNPAVSVGVFLSDRCTLDLLNLILYVVAEFVGGMVGSTVSAALIGSSTVFSPSSSYSSGQTVVLELVVTTMLCLMVQTAAINGSFGPLGAFYIGLVVVVGVIVAGPITGGCFNPAVALAQFVVNAVVNPGEFLVTNFFLYLLVPFVGSILSSLLFHIFYCELYIHCKMASPHVAIAGEHKTTDKLSTDSLALGTSQGRESLSCLVGGGHCRPADDDGRIC
eukprot:GHVS01040329.1.p1 GENE.GHVS01040329.1~~GHVS01040329.1.p1  ORF type:complete len:316 (+),score=34.72 GHVS01040329.1:153-1100(+)